MKNYGIDVSKWQGVIDWAKVKADGVDFAIIRAATCGANGSIISQSRIDPQFINNVKGATEQGIPIGVYLFSYAQTEAAARVAARDLASLMKGYEFEYPIVFDMETEGTGYEKNTKAMNTRIAIAFLDEIAALGYYPMFYSYLSFINSNINASELDYDIWVAHLNVGTDAYANKYPIHQYSWTGRYNGISGDVDLNVGFVDYPTKIRESGLNYLGLPTIEDPSVDETPEEKPGHNGCCCEKEERFYDYIVLKGDTMWDIAIKEGVPFRDLVQSNPQIKDPNRIWVGDVLHIPMIMGCCDC